MKQRQKVVITGIGAIAPNGIGRRPFWETLKNGINCVDIIKSFDASSYPFQIAAEIKNFEHKNYLSSQKAKTMGRPSHFAIAATREAIEDGKLILKDVERNRIGVILGSGAGGLAFYEEQMKKSWGKKYEEIDPYTFATSFYGSVTEEVSNEFGFGGPSILLSNGCTSSNDAVGVALSMIREGDIDMAFAGGSEACITPGIVAAFCRMGALSTCRNHEPKKASRPFNIDRDGFVIAEGAWIFILESLKHAQGRGAGIYAEVAGYGATCDAYHVTKPLPSGEETARAIKMALADANLQSEELQYINAHGTATQLNDKTETLAIKLALGKHAQKVAVSSMKSMIGHAIGAAGAGGIAACALAIRDSYIPPTINYENPDPECDLDYVANKGRECKVNVALGNSIGFGSKNACVVLKEYK